MAAAVDAPMPGRVCSSPDVDGKIPACCATTTWAPSGIAYADGSLFFAGLRGSALYEVTFGPNGTVAGVTPHLEGQYGRLRAVVLGPDGYLYVTTSNLDGRGTPRPGDDQILKIHPDFFK